jgi:hypothetical protein
MKFVEGLKYSFIRPKGLTNIFWILVPILGLFILIGYMVDVVNSIVSGQKEQGLPAFRGFGETLGEGFMYIIRAIPMGFAVMLVAGISAMINDSLGLIVYLLLTFFYIPIATINLMVKKKVSATFEFKNIFGMVFQNFVGYLSTLIKTIGFLLVTGVLSLVLVGIPMQMLASNVYIADFYREKIVNI